MRPLQKLCFIGLLLLVLFQLCSRAYAQDSISIDDVEFAPSLTESDTAPAMKEHAQAMAATPEEGSRSERSLWVIFLAGIAGGFAALFMPCIFPMLPFTVSYFTKSSKESAVGQALIYGISIC